MIDIFDLDLLRTLHGTDHLASGAEYCGINAPLTAAIVTDIRRSGEVVAAVVVKGIGFVRAMRHNYERAATVIA